MRALARRSALGAFAVLLATSFLFGATAKPGDKEPEDNVALVSVVFDDDGLGYNVTSSRDISNIQVDFCVEANEKYDGLQGFTFRGRENAIVVGVWVKSGDNGNKSDPSTPPGGGEYILNGSADCDPDPTCMELGNCPAPTCEELDNCVEPTCEELDNCVAPTCEELDNCVAPTCEELDNCVEPTCEELDNCVAPTCEELDNCVAPTCEELDNCVEPTCEELDNCAEPTCVELQNCVEATCEELNDCVEPTCEELGNCQEEEAEVPFFTSPTSLVLGTLGAVGGSLAILVRRKP